MEPTYSLQSHIFTDLQNTAYRDINIYNPLKIQHPPNGTTAFATGSQYESYLDPISLSAVGDARPESINLIVPQDCGGFNLGSFFVRRSEWTDRLLDIWWDPVLYEQRHMQWEHKEQDALENLYINQPWVRPSVAFLPQRKINAFPNGACGDDRGLPKAGVCPRSLTQSILGGEEDPNTECGVQGIHYQAAERDFLVNMAGCEWGRDCWAELWVLSCSLLHSSHGADNLFFHLQVQFSRALKSSQQNLLGDIQRHPLGMVASGRDSEKGQRKGGAEAQKGCGSEEGRLTPLR